MKKKIIAVLTMLLIGIININKVYADENFNYSNALWSYTYSNPTTDCNSSLKNCTINNYLSNMSLNTASNGNYINTMRLYAYASDSNKFKSSNYYTFKYEVCQNEKDLNSIKKRGKGFAWQYNTSNAATGSTAGDPTQFSYKIDDKVGDNKCYFLTFSAKPPVDSRYIGFFFTYTGYGDNVDAAVIPDVDYFNSTGGTINVKNLNITYSQDVNATINNSTNQIINNNNQNTQQIIDNQNQNTQETINSQKTCNIISNADVIIKNKWLGNEGQIKTTSNSYGITEYININTATIELITLPSSSGGTFNCFYNKDKVLISCINNDTLYTNGLGNINIPENSYYLRTTLNYNTNKPKFKVCKDGNQAIQDTLNQEHEYNNEPNRDTTAENNELTSYEQEEQQLLNSLNLNIEDAEVTINGNASSFIWEIINRIRETSGKIVLLFTSVLSLGIIKLILGR